MFNNKLKTIPSWIQGNISLVVNKKCNLANKIKSYETFVINFQYFNFFCNNNNLKVY